MKASDHFHQEENLNCAQAILRYFDAQPELIARYRPFGGGRAPEGLCGALFAAKALLNDERKFTALCEKFGRETGGRLACRELKAEPRVPCERCVDLVGEILQELNQSSE